MSGYNILPQNSAPKTILAVAIMSDDDYFLKIL